jgi:site-specific DNA-methyltransferase (adenine-specific)|tara:strand:- start:2417 stop:3940 length:1524 start_codon:yes stop_codon:yes gene_type:complete
MLGSFHNPDILTCLANLSSDEVFTPPDIANQMLDSLPKELWSDKNVTFLDPVSKSGIFLREITKRLLKGLEGEIPNIEERIEHILRKQVFGLGITSLTSQISRRTLYCSKKANGEYSIVNFGDEEGNLKYIESHHFWADGIKCKYCGVNKKLYQRNKGLESYAYSFIHEDKPEELFNMKFDVIIGNPPYQMNDGGGTGSSAVPLYQKFVDVSKRLKPRFCSMIIPSRWYSGGRGLDEFRKNMLTDESLKELHDFEDSSDCFSGVEIKGGVCYFLWDREYKGDCLVTSHNKSNKSSVLRPLLEKGMNNFIRRNESVSIIKKVKETEERTFDELISANDPFGFDKRERGKYKRVKPSFKLKKQNGLIPFYYHGWKKDGLGYVDKNLVTKSKHLISNDKIYLPKAWGTGSLKSDRLETILVEGESCSTETYLIITNLSKEELLNVQKYMSTKFFHFLVLALKNTQNAMKKVYSLVPLQDFSIEWNDKTLYKKYKLTEEEINFIETSTHTS